MDCAAMSIQGGGCSLMFVIALVFNMLHVMRFDTLFTLIVCVFRCTAVVNVSRCEHFCLFDTHVTGTYLCSTAANVSESLAGN